MPINVDGETTRERQARVQKSGDEWENHVRNYLKTALKDSPITILFGDNIPKNSKLWERLSVPLKSSDQNATWGDIDLIAAIDDFPICVISCKLSLHGRFTETLFYSTLFRSISHIRTVLATPDAGRAQKNQWTSEWGTQEDPSKDRLLAENYLDGVYVRNLPQFCHNMGSSQATALGGILRPLEDLPNDLIRWSEDTKRLIRKSKSTLNNF